MKNKRESNFPLSVFAALLSFGILARCELPPGCGPGDIPSNPLSSNLVEYTKPASGAILFQEDFTKLKIKMLRPVDKATFSVADDVRLFEIRNFWESDRQEIPYPGGASAVLAQAAWACPSESCDRIDLVVNSSALEQLRHYRIRILGVEPADADDPATPLSTPAADGAVALAHDVDVIVGVGQHVAGAPPPSLRVSSDPLLPASCFDKDSSDFNTPECLVSPHQKLVFPFCGLMGYTFFDVEPIPGLNFKYTVERVSWPG